MYIICKQVAAQKFEINSNVIAALRALWTIISSRTAGHLKRTYMEY